MTDTLPLFPLGTVLFPGMLLPLHIFEDRYKQLMQELLDGPEPRRFGVIAIRKGRETGIEGVSSLYEVGCTATLRETEESDDGSFELVAVGTQRFRLEALEESRPYLRGEVEFLAEDAGESAAAGRAAHLVADAFRAYLGVLADRGLAQINVPDLPEEPVLLSYLVAASMIIDLPDRQRLLAEPDSASRLAAERSMLVRETTMLQTLTARPAPDLRYTPFNPN
ncbi:MAG TPA: LON peptidase substrate-binding domain-containing protein [Streptosporangiaceae bacterium]